MKVFTHFNYLIFYIFLLLVIFCILTRLITYEEAFERDLMVYSVTATGINDGRPLYTEMWDHKPPAIHWTYALIMKVTGCTPLSIFLLGVGATIASMYGIYWAGCLLESPVCGILAAGIWAVFSGDLYLQANQPNVEVFMNVCLVFGFVMVLRYGISEKCSCAVLAGILFFGATLYKTVAIITVFCLCAANVLSPFLQRDRSIPRHVLTKKGYFSLVLGATACTGWAGIFLYFHLHGNFNEFYDAVFIFNQTYAGNIFFNIVKGFSLNTHDMYVLPLIFMCLIVGFQLVGNAWKEMEGQNSQKAFRLNSFLLLAYLIGAWLALAMPGKYFPHYYQLLLPPLSLGISWMLINATKRKAWILPLVFCLTLTLCFRFSQFSLPLNQIPIYKYSQGHGLEALESKKIGLWLRQHGYRDRNVYMWGAEPGIYFWAGIHPVIGLTYLKPMAVYWKNRSKLIRNTLRQLNESKPEIIIANRKTMSILRNHPVTIWIRTNYTKENKLSDLSVFDCYHSKAAQ